MIKIVLMQPENPGNLGAVARAMANFGLNELILVEPLPGCKKSSAEARNRAKHAQDILKKAKVVKKSYLKKFDYLIGTTAKLGTEFNLPRVPVTIKDLAVKLSGIDPNKKDMKIGLLIGRESTGLTNEEILGCDFVVTIPASKTYPTLNISHACAILFYEIFQAENVNLNSKPKKSNERITPISAKDKEIVLKYLDNILDKIKFATPEKKETQRIVWKRIITKSMMTKREAFAVIGLWKKIIERL